MQIRENEPNASCVFDSYGISTDNSTLLQRQKWKFCSADTVRIAQISLVEYSSIQTERFFFRFCCERVIFALRSQADGKLFLSPDGIPEIQKYRNHINLPVTCTACKSIRINIHIWVDWPITASLSSLKNIYKRVSSSYNHTSTSVYWVIVHARVCRYSLHARDNLDQWKWWFGKIIPES